MTIAPLVELKNIGVQRAGRWLLHNINLTVHPGEIVTIIGPNGAGKTTLLRVLLGLCQPTQGSIHLASSIIGYMPQQLHVEATLPLTIERFLNMGQIDITQENMTKMLHRVGLSLPLKNSFHALSGGELQRILLARALLRNPQLLVLDEPAQGVDITGQMELYDLLANIRRELNCGIVQVSHDLHLVMAATDTVICLNQHICCSGHPDTVSQHPEFLRLFGAAAQTLAVYHHHHDHHHTSTGEVIPDDR